MSTPWLGDFTNSDAGIPIFRRREFFEGELPPPILPGIRTPIKNLQQVKDRVSALLKSLDSTSRRRKRASTDEPVQKSALYMAVETYYNQLFEEEYHHFPSLRPAAQTSGVGDTEGMTPD